MHEKTRIECLKIIGFIKQGYTPTEIKTTMKLSDEQYRLRTMKIRDDDMMAPYVIGPYEDIISALRDLWRRLYPKLDEAESSSEYLAISRELRELSKEAANTAVKFGMLEPIQRLTLAESKRLEKEYDEMTDEELLEVVQHQMSKHAR